MTPAARHCLECCRAQNLRHFKDLLSQLESLDRHRKELCDKLRNARDAAYNCNALLSGKRRLHKAHPIPAVKPKTTEKTSVKLLGMS